MNYYLAVDIGASSGRHILCSVQNGKMCLEEVYRFENGAHQKGKHLCWDTAALYESILNGLKQCKKIGKIPATMGIDTWAVDYVLLDGNDEIIGDTVAYRDARTEGLKDAYPFSKLYAKTGIQYQPFNTIYQLLAQKRDEPAQLERAQSLLMIPDYFNFRLTGVKIQEYTNATSTALVNAETHEWDMGLIDELGLPQRLFKKLSMPGTRVGELTRQVQNDVGFNCTVILPATHDTGSAFLAVPARDDNAVYISSGTWSLLGVENEAPITTPESAEANFTNEGGYNYRFRYLKNIMGLWMIQSIRRNLEKTDKKYSFAELENMARECGEFPSRVNVNDSAFLAPESMVKAVQNYCINTNQPVPEKVGEIMQTVYTSLAESYANSIKELEALTGKTYTSINIVGGGSKDGYLNELTAKAARLPVYAGPTEGTALGNLMVQLIAAGEYKNLADARNAVKKSFDIKEIQP